MKKYFCTLFDSGYLFKGVTMLTSLKVNCSEAVVFVLCMDTLAAEVLASLKMDFVICVALSQVENAQALDVKKGRNTAEYCWTMSSFFTYWVMENHPEVDVITYLDADLMFFSAVQPIFDEMANASIAITEHRFITRLQHLESKGRFCVQWVGFRRNAQGMRCLKRWKNQCLDWCYDRLEDGKMGDQKYLDSWPNDFPETRIIEHAGVGVAPWNYASCTFTKTADQKILVNGVPIIFYHFHQFQLLDDGTYYRLAPYYAKEEPAPDIIYSIYEQRMTQTVASVRAIWPDFAKGMKSHAQAYSRRWVQTYIPRFIKENLKRIIRY